MQGCPKIIRFNRTHSFQYCAGRIVQHRVNGSEYFLGDALGSVRQVTDSAGAVTLAKSYEPYTESVGSRLFLLCGGTLWSICFEISFTHRSRDSRKSSRGLCLPLMSGSRLAFNNPGNNGKRMTSSKSIREC